MQGFLDYLINNLVFETGKNCLKHRVNYGLIIVHVMIEIR